MKSKRHAKPTSAQLVARMYRRQIALETEIMQLSIRERDRDLVSINRLDSLASGQRMLSERMESFRVLADHCARLLREKETLMKRQKDATWNGITPETAECIRSLRTGSIHTEAEQLFKRFESRANKYPYSSVDPSKCSFASSHVIGIVCGICGTRGGPP